MLTVEERASLIEDLAILRRAAAWHKREIDASDKAGANHAARALAAEMVGDDAPVAFHTALSRCFYRDMTDSYEARAITIQSIRRIERELERQQELRRKP